MSDPEARSTSPLELARALAGDVARRGGRALVVGGFVRDRLLGRTSKDLDLEVFGIAQDDLLPILARFGRVETVGQSFPVYKLGPVDVALPRRESKSGRGHKGFVVQGDPWMTVGDAARRRDFTINAILWDPLNDEILDPVGGRADLDARCLRVVDADTFGDDSLRVLRALQFAHLGDERCQPEHIVTGSVEIRHHAIDVAPGLGERIDLAPETVLVFDPAGKLVQVAHTAHLGVLGH